MTRAGFTGVAERAGENNHVSARLNKIMASTSAPTRA